MPKTRCAELATIVDAYHRCVKVGNHECGDKHKERIEAIMRSAPSGSGIDSGTHIDLELSSADKLVFHADYHHMHEFGCYDGWTEHTIRAVPSFIHGVKLTISGKNRNAIKDSLHEVFHCWLTATDLSR